jgi:hypothetical protein
METCENRVLSITCNTLLAVSNLMCNDKQLRDETLHIETINNGGRMREGWVSGVSRSFTSFQTLGIYGKSSRLYTILELTCIK